MNRRECVATLSASVILPSLLETRKNNLLPKCSVQDLLDNPKAIESSLKDLLLSSGIEESNLTHAQTIETSAEWESIHTRNNRWDIAGRAIEMLHSDIQTKLLAYGSLSNLGLTYLQCESFQNEDLHGFNVILRFNQIK